MLNLDSSLLFVLLLVWLLSWLLNKIYYKPVGNVIHKREARVEQDSRKLESLTSEIEQKTGAIEDKLRDARQNAMRIREELFQKGEAVRNQTVTEAREKARTQLAESMKKLEKEIQSAEQKLEQEVEEFSHKIIDIFL